MADFKPQLAVPKGNWGTVEFAVRASGKQLAKQFLREMGGDSFAALALFREMAAQGHTNCPNRFSKEKGKIYAFKIEIENKQFRFPCFSKGARWIVTHGFQKRGAQKGKGKWPAEEFKRAADIMAEHLLREGK